MLNTRQPRLLSEDELRFLRLMANQAAIAVDGLRLRQEEVQRQRMQEELAVGRQIQLSMLPKACPIIPGWQIVAVYQAARMVGGDFYDFFELPGAPRRVGMLVADVADKGVPAALFMALSRTVIRTHRAQRPRGRRGPAARQPVDPQRQPERPVPERVLRHPGAGDGPVALRQCRAQPAAVVPRGHGRGAGAARPRHHPGRLRGHSPSKSGASWSSRATCCSSTPTASPRR